MKPEELSRIIETILKVSRADETEVSLWSRRYALTRFANNVIHQNLVQNEQTVLVRVRLGNRVGESEGNRTGGDDLKRLVEAATEAAEVSTPDEELLPLPGPQEYKSVNAWNNETDIAGPGNRAEAVREIVKTCKAETLTAAGAFETTSEQLRHANSRGLEADYSHTLASLSVTAMDADNSGWASATARNIREIDAEMLARTAVHKAVLGREAQSVEAGEYPVILEPAALMALVEYVADGFNARQVDQGESFLAREQIGERITGAGINLRCDPYHPMLQGQPFDGEGLPNRRVVLVEDGVAANLLYDRITAEKHDAEPSGYSAGGASKEGAWPSYIVMDGGGTSVDEMIGDSERAILVTRIWYTSLVDIKKLIVTGLTRDGTFLIEDGRIVKPLHNMRFNVPVLDALGTLEALGPQRCCRTTLMPTPAVIPAAQLGAFRFTSETSF